MERLLARVAFTRAVPIHRPAVPNVTLTIALRAALVLLIARLVFPLCWPLQRVAGLHVVFIAASR